MQQVQSLTSDLSAYVTLAGTETITGIKNFNLGLTLQDGYYPTPATGYVGLGSNGSGITILTKSGITVYNNNLQFPNASNDYNFPNATGTLALTSDLSAYVTLAGTETITGAKTFSATSLTLAPTSGGGTLNLKQDAFLGATNGYTSLTSSGSDFAIIAATGVGTSKQAVFSLASLGATLRTYTLPDANGILALTSDLSAYVTLAGTETITGAKTFSGLTSFTNTSGINLQYGAYINKGNTPLAFSSGNTNIYSDATTNNIVIRDNLSIAKLEFNNSTQTYTFPAATGTIALTSDLTGGTVTSVAALTIGTTGTDLSSTVANSTTTPVITLNVPTASAVNRGALSSADWTTFNNKQSALTNPVTGTGTTNYLPKFTGASTIGNSILQEGTNAIGLGVTPSAWYSLSGYAALQVGNASLFGRNSANSELYLSSNAYDNSSGNPTYITTDFAARYVQNDGVHSWLTAASGTAGNAITFTQAMTLTAAGNLGIGTASPDAALTIKSIETAAKGISIWGRSDNIGTLRFFNSTGATEQGGLISTSTYLGFIYADTERMRITSGGNILIGTTTDSGYKLDVNGTGRFSGALTLNGGDIDGTLGDAIYFGNAIYPSAQKNRIRSSISASSANSLVFETSTATTGVYNTNQFVLLGTGAATFSGLVTGQDGIYQTNASSLVASNKFGTYNAGATNMNFNYPASGSVTFENGSPRLTIASTGNVGIGTSPTAKLSIQGTGTYNSTSFGPTATVNIRSNEFTNDTWNSVLNIALIRQSLSTGSLSYGGIGFTTIDDSNAAEITDAARIAITNDNPSSTTSPTSMSFWTNTGGTAGNVATERMRITSGGALQVKSGDSSETISVYTNVSTTNWAFSVGGSGTINGIAIGASSAATMMRMNKDSGSTRSLNAAGTLNASGADYAEYMIKAIDDIIAKGDVVGVNSNGLLTNVFIDSISFAVKSSDPSFVGNDTWGADLEIEALEAARIKVDRIAFSGQVPCNVYDANVGDYIIPIDDNGKIKGQAITNPTFEQYQLSVGKVWKIMEDGRAWIAVKIG
jgi:hypothetical protein